MFDHPARRLASGALMLCALLGAWDAHASRYVLGSEQDQIIGEDGVYVTLYQDTLYDLARRLDVGSEELIAANPGIDPWIPGAGKQITIPGRHILPHAPRVGIVVNLPEHRLYYYPPTARGAKPEVWSFPVSIGKMDWQSPLGETRVIGKQKDPIWIPTASVRAEHAANGEILPVAIGPGPDNPLGRYALRLAAGGGTYLIHGTNNPIAVGMAVTHGCIRLYPDDIQRLFPMIPVGTRVVLLDEPMKVALVNDELLLETHPQLDPDNFSELPDMDLFGELVTEATGGAALTVQEESVKAIIQAATGAVAVVGRRDTKDPAPSSQAPPTAPL